MKRFAFALLVACVACDQPTAKVAPPPDAEFLVAAGDSTYWVRSGADGVQVRSAPILLAFDGAAFLEIYVTDQADDYEEAAFVAERLWVRRVGSADSATLFADSSVHDVHRLWRRGHPEALLVDPEEEDLPDPATFVTDQVDVLDVHGPYVSWAHALDIDVDGPLDGYIDHVHQRRRGVHDVRTASRVTLTELLGAKDARRLTDAGREALRSMQRAVQLLPDERAARASATIAAFVFDSTSFTITDQTGAPAIAFFVSGPDSSGEARELMLPVQPLTTRPEWWSNVGVTLPAWSSDSLRVYWDRANYGLEGRVTPDSLHMALLLKVTIQADTNDTTAGDTTPDRPPVALWPVVTVPRPVYQVIPLDQPPFSGVDRVALRRAFDRASQADLDAALVFRRAPRERRTSLRLVAAPVRRGGGLSHTSVVSATSVGVSTNGSTTSSPSRATTARGNTARASRSRSLVSRE